ncbi:MAG: hypothetical protein P8Z78_03860 [Gammaproteobacteria bacterium]|jgi:hypothetical protein
MRLLSRLLLPALAVPLFAATLAGCARTDDVRLVLCKEVTDRLLASKGPLEWTGNSQRIKRPAYAVIHLDFKAGPQGEQMSSECYFEYNAVEENVMTQVDELSAYSTLPYRMTIEGRDVPKPILQKAVSEEQIEGLSEFLDKLREAPRRLQSS